MSHPALRYRKTWIQLGIAGLGLLSIIALWPYKLDASAPHWTDKALHVSAYVVVTSWFFQIFHRRSGRITVIACLLLYGLGIEGLQYFAPMRSASFEDLLANMTGISIGWLLCLTPLQFLLHRFESRFFSSSATTAP